MDVEHQHPHGLGLVDRVRASTVSESAAAELTLEFLSQWVTEKITDVRHSICQDRRFMARHMPALEHFSLSQSRRQHAQNIDARWRPDTRSA